MIMGKDHVVLLDFWASVFGMRVRIALGEKGIEYEFKEENLMLSRSERSELLSKVNSMHKKIPVLIHNGRPICESLIILQYVDETWPGDAPLLPSDPYDRAQARFWADYADKKVYDAGKKVYFTKGNTEEKVKEFIEILKVLEEKALGDKPFFGGGSFGFLDIVMVSYYSWFYSYEEEGNFKVEDSCPKLITWGKRCMQRDSVAKGLADSKKIHVDLVKVLQTKFGVK